MGLISFLLQFKGGSTLCTWEMCGVVFCARGILTQLGNCILVEVAAKKEWIS